MAIEAVHQIGDIVATRLAAVKDAAADVLPSYVTEMSETPSPTHPLGIRPAGEGGTIPALAVERVWRAMRDA